MAKDLIRNLTLPRLAWTLWFTGLPCSGKSTLTRSLERELQLRGIAVEILDADVLRSTISKGLGFSKADRDENVVRIGWLCGLLTKWGVTTLVAAISPYREARERLRQTIPHFIEIFVKAPIGICMERDVKGLYSKALRREVLHFTGVDDPYEEPLNPDIVIETDRSGVAECTRSILKRLEEMRVIDLTVLA